ncbi:hypothetical protein BDZ89DRAFT_1076237 [Hymenopellis radicata]|nr:hypothetical protein BDZ89DRAFT_1076237 [Hymenopellis radicata]
MKCSTRGDVCRVLPDMEGDNDIFSEEHVCPRNEGVFKGSAQEGLCNRDTGR